MNNNIEQIVAKNQAAIDSLLTVANTALASAERIAALNLNTVRTAVEETAANTKAVLGAKDVQEAVAIQSNLVKPAAEKAAAYGKSLYEITTESQQELGKLVEAQFADFQKSMQSLLEQAVKAAPAGSDNIVATIQNSIAQANSAFGNIFDISKQFAQAAQATVASATAPVKKSK